MFLGRAVAHYGRTRTLHEDFARLFYCALVFYNTRLYSFIKQQQLFEYIALTFGAVTRIWKSYNVCKPLDEAIEVI